MFPRFSFAKLMTAIVCAYIMIASIYPIKNANSNIGFLLSLATLWANPPSDASRDIKSEELDK